MDKRILLGVIFVTAMHAFNELVLLIAMPAINTDLNASQWYGLMIASYIVAAVSAMVWAGRSIDECGPGKILNTALAVMLVGHGLAITSWDTFSFVLARVLQGVGGGAGLTVAFALVNLCFRVEDKPRVINYVDFAWVVPSLLAPIIGGWLVDYAHWRWIFVVQLFPLLAAAVLLYSSLSHLNKDASLISWSTLHQSMLLAVGFGLLVFSLSAPMGWIWLLFIPGVLIASVALKSSMPAHWYKAREPLGIAIVVTLVSYTAFFGLEAFFPLFVTSVFSLDSFQSGLMLTAASVGWLMGSTLQARKMNHHSQVQSLRLGYSMLLLGMAMNAAVVFRVSEPFLGYPAWYISGIGMGVLANSSKTFSMKFSPGNRDGQTAMAMSLAANLGIGVAVTVGGTLKNFFGSQSDALAISMVAILAVSTTLVFAGWTISFVTNAAHLGNVNRD